MAPDLKQHARLMKGEFRFARKKIWQSASDGFHSTGAIGLPLQTFRRNDSEPVPLSAISELQAILRYDYRHVTVLGPRPSKQHSITRVYHTSSGDSHSMT